MAKNNSKGIITKDDLKIMSLNQVLKTLGFTTEPTKNDRKHIIRNGEIVFSGRAHDVWSWLRDKQYVPDNEYIK